MSVYGLNGILDHPECRKRRPQVVEAPPAPPVENIPQKEKPPQTARPADFASSFTRPSPASRSNKSLSRLPDKMKKEIAVLITHFLMSMGREDLSDQELRDIISVFCSTPITSANNSRSTTKSAPTQFQGPNSNRSNQDRHLSPPEPVFGNSDHTDPWRISNRNIEKVHGMASTRTSGLAVPELPVFTA